MGPRGRRNFRFRLTAAEQALDAVADAIDKAAETARELYDDQRKDVETRRDAAQTTLDCLFGFADIAAEFRCLRKQLAEAEDVILAVAQESDDLWEPPH